jgi:hypothetical protein
MLLLKILNDNSVPWNLITTGKDATNIVVPCPMTLRHSFQRREAFFPAFSIEKWSMTIWKCLLCHWQLTFKFFHPAFAQSLYDVKQKTQLELSEPLAIRFLIANYCMGWRCNHEGLSQDEGLADLSKISAPLSLIILVEWSYVRPDPSRWTVPLIPYDLEGCGRAWV